MTGYAQTGFAMEHWFYEREGMKVGPIDEDAFRQLLQNGELDTATKVWTPKFGADWRQLGNTEWAAINAKAKHQSAPPSNLWIALIASLPLLMAALGTAIGSYTGQYNTSGEAILTLILYFVFLARDRRAIAKAGRPDVEAAIKRWALIPPIYLYLRSSKLKLSQWPVSSWVLVVLVATIVSAFAPSFLSQSAVASGRKLVLPKFAKDYLAQHKAGDSDDQSSNPASQPAGDKAIIPATNDAVAVEITQETRQDGTVTRWDGDTKYLEPNIITRKFLKVTSKTDDISINSIEINRGNCEALTLGEPWKPVSLKFGESTSVWIVCDPIEAKIGTDRGVYTFTW